jgi:hypothetical protein
MKGPMTVIVAGGALIGVLALNAHDGNTSTPPSDELHLPPVRDGKFEFTLWTWNTNAGTLRVVNTGDRSWSYHGSNQKAVDTQGRRFDCDGGEADDIQPGGEYLDTLICRNGDVAVASLEVHDSWLSGGTALPVNGGHK